MKLFNKKTLLTIAKIYLPIFCFILGWWAIAFHGSSISTRLISHNKTNAILPTNHQQGLSEIKRPHLQEALAGNIKLMNQFIIDWDIDAQLLQDQGFTDAKRLPLPVIIRSREVVHQLNLNLEHQPSQEIIFDDAGHKFLLETPYHRFLPQTYAVASFLLAIAPIHEILALPSQLRKQTQLFPESITSQIPLDIDRYNGEKLFLAGPEVAFIAHYSNPTTVEVLSKQGAIIYTMRNPATIDDVTAELLNIGHLVNRPLHAELLKIFMDATFLALDNRLLLQEEQPTLLYLNYHHNYAVPTLKTLTGQLLGRLTKWDISLKYVKETQSSDNWMLPIDKERILNLDPDILIIAAENSFFLETEIRNDSALKQLKSVRNNQLIIVDETIQHSPSQYILLAYYDLIHPLL